jgi:2-methylisocitrate lyase-like PEP mutase family enzyme
MGLRGPTHSVKQLEDMGVKRISIGSSLARAAYGGFHNAAREIIEKGTFSYADDIITYDFINDLFK